MSLYGVARGAFEANSYASIFDVIEAKYRSTAVGLVAMCSFLIGSLSPLFIGFMSERAKCPDDPMGVAGFGRGFAVLGGIYLLGAVAVGVAFMRTFKKDRLMAAQK